jgi:hypothetical protein
MFEPTSRYAPIAVANYATPDGRVIAYKRRRFLPESANMALLVETVLQQTERLDHLTARTLGDPEQFWRVCDASDVMNPAEIPADATRVLRVPVPQP